MKIEEEVGKLLKKKGLTISVVESCTGGLIQKLFTDIPGSSQYFIGGIVAYSDKIKQKLVGVEEKTLIKYGAVSSEVACELAYKIRQLSGTDIGVSTTGIAGPGGGTSEKPVGLVYIGVSTSNSLNSYKFLFQGGRSKIRAQTAKKVFELIKKLVLEIH